MRLTEKDDLGHWFLKGLEWGQLREGRVITKDVAQKLYGALCKLKDYEDTGASPDNAEELEARNTPQKVIYRKDRYGSPWLCPVCEADQTKVVFISSIGAAVKGKHSYCWKCGQKIDWDVEEN